MDNGQLVMEKSISEMPGNQKYKPCSICKKMMNVKSLTCHLRNVYKMVESVKRKVDSDKEEHQNKRKRKQQNVRN